MAQPNSSLALLPSCVISAMTFFSLGLSFITYTAGVELEIIFLLWHLFMRSSMQMRTRASGLETKLGVLLQQPSQTDTVRTLVKWQFITNYSTAVCQEEGENRYGGKQEFPDTILNTLLRSCSFKPSENHSNVGHSFLTPTLHWNIGSGLCCCFKHKVKIILKKKLKRANGENILES